MKYYYKTKGVCSRSITLDVEDGILKDVQFEGGCDGNSSGIVALVRGMPAREVVKRLRGIRCEEKNTSCPDQLAIAIEQAVGGNSEDAGRKKA